MRLHAAINDPHASVDVLVSWDDTADPNEVEEAVKAAARDAIKRFREAGR